jgi:hypothetical protein
VGTEAAWLLSLKGADGVGGGNAFPYSSTSSITVGFGVKTANVATGLSLFPGRFYRLFSKANPSNYVEGICISYASGVFTVDVDMASGSGSFSDVSINIASSVSVLSPTATFTSTSITPANVPGLLFRALANVTYDFKFHGLYTSSAATTGATLGVGFSGTASLLTGLFKAGIVSTAVASGMEVPLSTSKLSITSTGTGAASQNCNISVEGVYKFPVNTDVTLTFASEVDLSLASLLDQSALVYMRIG